MLTCHRAHVSSSAACWSRWDYFAWKVGLGCFSVLEWAFLVLCMNCVWTETRSWRWIQLRRHCETLKPPYTLLLVNRMICQHRQNWRICNIRLKRGSQTTVKRPDNLEMMHHLLPFWALYMLWTPVGTVRLIKWSDYKCLNILIASPSPLLFSLVIEILYPFPVLYAIFVSFPFHSSSPFHSTHTSSPRSHQCGGSKRKGAEGNTSAGVIRLSFIQPFPSVLPCRRFILSNFCCYLNSLKHFSVFFFVIWGMKCWFPVVNRSKCWTGLKSVPLDCGSDSHPVDNISKRENFSKFILNPCQVCQSTLYLVLNTTVCVMLRHTRYQGWFVAYSPSTHLWLSEMMLTLIIATLVIFDTSLVTCKEPLLEIAANHLLKFWLRLSINIANNIL